METVRLTAEQEAWHKRPQVSPGLPAMAVAAQVSRGGGGRLGDFLESTLAACALIRKLDLCPLVCRQSAQNKVVDETPLKWEKSGKP